VQQVDAEGVPCERGEDSCEDALERELRPARLLAPLLRLCGGGEAAEDAAEQSGEQEDPREDEGDVGGRVGAGSGEADLSGADAFGAEAGLVPGDVLLSVDGVSTNARFEEDLPAVRKLIADLPINKEVNVRVQRGDEEIDIPVTTQALSDLRGKEIEFSEWGFTASELTPNIVRRAQLSSNKGVLISGVQLGGIAGNAGLIQGDIVLKLDGAEIEALMRA